MNHLPGLNGLRGAAVLVVVLFHYRGSLPAIARPVVSWGWLGVDVFFVLSGFLCTRILLSAPPVLVSAGRFVARRLLRTWPVYFVTLGILVAAGAVPLTPFAWYGQNLRSEPLGILAHTWSLAVEEQFYLALPLVWLLVGKRALPWVLLAVAVGAATFRGLLVARGELWLAHVHPLARFDALAIGGLLACWGARWDLAQARAAAWSLVPLLVYVASWPDGATTHGIAEGVAMPLLVAIGSAGLVRIAFEGGIVTRILERRWLADLGKVSYGVYVYHAVVQALGRRYIHGALMWHLPYESALAISLCCEFVILVVVVKVSWRWLEQPALRLKRFV